MIALTYLYSDLVRTLHQYFTSQSGDYYVFCLLDCDDAMFYVLQCASATTSCSGVMAKAGSSETSLNWYQLKGSQPAAHYLL